MRLIQLFPLALTALLGFAPVTGVQADTMEMRSIGDVPAGVQIPQRAITMGQVKMEFGEPVDTKPAVGEPPITRWEYANFTVFFEYNRVIESVVHPASMAQYIADPAPATWAQDCYLNRSNRTPYS